ncbi:MAG: hypothetical protein ACYS7Y_24800 [Planctomycetota bacterium]
MVQASERKLLPILKVDGTEYLVDINRREFREFNDPANVINMHSKIGRTIVEQSLGKEWHSFGLAKPIAQSNYDMVACDRCDSGISAHS